VIFVGLRNSSVLMFFSFMLSFLSSFFIFFTDSGFPHMKNVLFSGF